VKIATQKKIFEIDHENLGFFRKRTALKSWRRHWLQLHQVPSLYDICVCQQVYLLPMIPTERPIFRDLVQNICGKFQAKIHSIVHFFSSVAYVWVPGAKTTGPIVKKFGFS
jgi:hypothetical protein